MLSPSELIEKYLRKPVPPEEFYIGWQAKAAAGNKKFVRLLVFALAVIIYIIASLLASNQEGFSSGIFERDSFTTLEGQLIDQPFPAIKTFYGKDIYGNPVLKTILLVNAGKFGADSIVAGVKRNNGNDLSSLQVTVRGKLIYNHGIAIMEMTEQDSAVREVKKISAGQKLPMPVIAELDSVTLQGQIIDSKCYFGVMKPAEGKPHSDCAIRCIAGGIQPMLVIRNAKGEETFFILRGENGEPINEKILCNIGMPVEVTGKLSKVDDWFVLKVNPSTGIKQE